MNDKLENKLIPQLRFPEFTGEWVVKRLEKLFSEFKSGQNITSTQIKEKGKYPVYGGNGLRGYFDEYTHDGYYFLIGRQGALCGNINRSIGKAFFSEHAIACKANEENDTEWLAQRLDYYNLNRLSESSAQPGLSVSKLLRFKLAVPTKPEQTKIADFLTAVDKRIELLQKKKKQLEQYKKGIMQKIFSQKIRFKDENGNDFPDWEEKRLGEIAEIYQPKTISQNQLTNEGYYVYGANGIIGKYKEYNHEKEQIAVTCRGNTCGTINFTKPYSWITGNAMVINLDKKPNVLKLFLFYLLTNSNLFYLITGSGQPQITGDIKLHKVKLPSITEQQKIANFLSSIDKLIETVEKQIEQSQQWKKGLLQKMFV